jgi:serine/threonine protein kinase
MPALLDMNTSPAELEPAERKPTMRFTYPSGSRPLDGYTIKRGVGRGGFGEVYFAVSDAGKEVALKLIRRNLEVELRGVTHCLNLKHPNLIDIYDIRTDEHDDRWVIMEYVAGASLEDMIDRYPDGMPKDMALHWFEGMCSAVAYLHDHGIVHRDLKPANIFVDEGRVKIGDYGLSKFISCSRRSGQTESVGTVHYMAPEIANGRYGREIDAYALGIILFEMLTGHVPFEGESVGEVLMKHLTAEPDLNRVEEPYRSVIRGAMAKDPERRIDNAAEMVAMLRGVPRTPVSDAAFQAAPASSAPFAGAAASPGSPAASPWIDPPASPRSPAGTSAARPASTGGFVEFFWREPEPVLAALGRGRAAFVRDLNWYQWPVLGRVGAAFAMIVVILATWPLWMLLAVAYFWYRFVRLFVQVVTEQPGGRRPQSNAWPADAAAMSTPRASAASPTPAAAAAAGRPASALEATAKHEPASPPPQSRRWRRRGQATWRVAAYHELASQPVRNRASGILASMLVAAAVAPVAALLACLFTIRDFNPELFLWAAVVGAVSSWAILIPGQLAEGRVEDQAPMRFIMLLSGAFVGLVAFGVAQGMYLELPTSRDFGIRPDDSFSAEVLDWRSAALEQGYDQRHAVSLPLAHYVAYFAFLFAAIRWWKQAEWTRSTRVSFWAMAWAGAAAFFLSLIWWFPQPLGIIAAAVISFTVQLASPWLPPSRRKQMAQTAAMA